MTDGWLVQRKLRRDPADADWRIVLCEQFQHAQARWIGHGFHPHNQRRSPRLIVCRDLAGSYVSHRLTAHTLVTGKDNSGSSLALAPRIILFIEVCQCIHVAPLA